MTYEQALTKIQENWGKLPHETIERASSSGASGIYQIFQERIMKLALLIIVMMSPILFSRPVKMSKISQNSIVRHK